MSTGSIDVPILHSSYLLPVQYHLCDLLYDDRGTPPSSQDRERIRFFEMQESHYLAQQRYITESSRQRHDFRQQLLSIAQMIQNGEYDALSGHLSEYISSLPESLTTLLSEHPGQRPAELLWGKDGYWRHPPQLEDQSSAKPPDLRYRALWSSRQPVRKCIPWLPDPSAG